MILIPGRTGKQGTTLNQGRLKPDYIAVTPTLEMNRDDMQKLGLKDGDAVRLSNEKGETVARCLGKKPEDLPASALFIACGPPSSALKDFELLRALRALNKGQVDPGPD